MSAVSFPKHLCSWSSDMQPRQQQPDKAILHLLGTRCRKSKARGKKEEQERGGGFSLRSSRSWWSLGSCVWRQPRPLGALVLTGNGVLRRLLLRCNWEPYTQLLTTVLDSPAILEIPFNTSDIFLNVFSA